MRRVIIYTIFSVYVFFRDWRIGMVRKMKGGETDATGLNRL